MKTKLLTPVILIIIVFTTLYSCKKNKDGDNSEPVNYNIYIYGITGCHYCTDFEDALKKDGVDYTFYDMDSNNVKRTEMINKLHAASIPENSIKWPVVDVMIDSISHMYIQPDYIKDVKPLIGK